MKTKKNNNELVDDLSVDEILKNIDIKIQEIESGKKDNEMTKTRIDDIDTKQIIKKLDDKVKELEKQERNKKVKD